MTEKILVAVDPAHAGAGVLDAAHEIAQLHKAELIVLTVLPTIPQFVDAFLPSHYHGDAERKALDTVMQRLAHKGWGEDTYKINVRHGIPYDEILEHSREIDADLVVVGSHAPSAADYLLGSTAAKVVRHAACSVYVVRARPKTS